MKTFKYFILILLCVFIFFSCDSFANTEKRDISVIKKNLLNHSLVVVKKNKVEVYDGRGLKPLVNYVKNNNFDNAYAGDRVIGKASALLFVYGGVEFVYTPLISKPAVEIFEKYHVSYEADRVVDNIKNRSGDDLCPMEKKVKHIENPDEAYEIFSNLF